jgi:mono/diheme cytochrome c family protein
MKRVFALFAIPLCAVALYGAEVSADSTRGAQVFEIQGCGDCHSLNGVGPSVGPDLSRLVDRGFTPASLAATMWNHAPGMWTETRLRGNARPALDEQQAADLFAFFYSLRFFEEPGDAGRGKALFSDRKCAECHGITSAKLPDAKPVMQWTAPADPLALVETMWNHSTKMRAEMERRKIKLPRLSGQELADLLVYVRSLQKLPLRAGVLQTPEAEQGKALFVSKTCASCHDPTTGFFSLQLREETLTDIASDMWNHGFDMSARKMDFQPDRKLRESQCGGQRLRRQKMRCMSRRSYERRASFDCAGALLHGCHDCVGVDAARSPHAEPDARQTPRMAAIHNGGDVRSDCLPERPEPS